MRSPLPLRRVVHQGRSSNVFLENGARLYLDVGSHPGTQPRSATRSPTWSFTTRPGRSSRRCSPPPSPPARGGSPARSICSRTTPTRRETPTDVTRTTSWPARASSRGWRMCSSHSSSRGRSSAARERSCTDREEPILHLAARRAHLGGRLERDDALEADHQYEGRAARGRRAIPAPPRDRGRFQHERVDHVHESRHHRSGAADGGVQQRDARPHPREPDPGDPRDLPRHELPEEGEARQRPELSAIEIQPNTTRRRHASSSGGT